MALALEFAGFWLAGQWPNSGGGVIPVGALFEPQVDIRGEGHRVFYGFGPPAAATDSGGVPFNVGDIVINVTPVNGAPYGWTCITAGSPGSWSPIGGGLDQYLEFSLTNTQLKATNSAPTAILPAQGAGTLIEVGSLVLENIFLTGAFANGGALALYYGVDATGVLATATVAATFLTSPAANQSIKVAGALASTLSSAVLNTGLVIANPTADFITGAGSLKGKMTYRVHTGL